MPLEMAKAPTLPKNGQVQPIVFWPSKNLETRSIEVPPELIGSDGLFELAQNMTATMLMTGGVGISAIQVGVPWRVIAIGVDREGNRLAEDDVIVLVNPVIDLGEGQVRMEEGCLSFPNVLQRVLRPESATVKAVTVLGEPVDAEMHDWMSRCLQHETDHLDGILFLDRMGRTARRLSKKQMSKMKKTVLRKTKPRPQTKARRDL